ncbi:hypothetical protein NDU88_004397 [Pleurodeles waltl]|uniref:Uncharacterized protein n=1 Tax=Pleurodeles waltl TaxID=8319 RepID=A0AAV7NNB3_PLEWA|nr:hypothetical protein NDU88_004397 [Pleurodeles waltl]
MLNRKTTGKAASRLARQLLFREALQQTQPMATEKGHQPEATSNITDAPKQDDTMERILQEISAIGRRLEGIDSNISSLAEKTKSIQTDIPGFQTRLMGLEQREKESQAETSERALHHQPRLLQFSDIIRGVKQENYRLL